MSIKEKIFFILLAAVEIYVIILTKDAFADRLPVYELNCSLDTKRHTLEAKQKVLFTNNSNKILKYIFFHIYSNRRYSEEEKNFLLRYAGYFKINPFPEGFQTGKLRINSVKEKNSNLSYKVEGGDETILRVELDEVLQPGDTLELLIDFSLSIPHSYGRFGWHSPSGKNQIISLCRWYPILSVLDEEGWHNYPFYPYHQPFYSEAAQYKLRFTLPKDYIVAHSGILKDEIYNEDTKTLILQTDKPIRDFSLVISSDYKIYSLDYNGIKINSYYLKGDDFYGQKAAEFARDLIDFYSNKFGEYPYKKFSIAPVYLGYAGNQSSNIILMDTRIYKLPKFMIRYFDFLISHETGHQWFYNLVGSDEYKQMWLDEGINSYFVLEYLESKYTRDAQVMVLPKNLKWLIPNFSFRQGAISRYIYLVKNGLDRPILGKLSSFKEPSSIFSLTYGKGSMVISMLHYLVGDKAFQKIFRRYFKEYSFSNIKVKDFIRIAEEESRQDLTDFFYDWLRTSKYCDYAVRSVDKNKIILENYGQISMPVKVEVEFEDGQRFIDIWNDRAKTRIIPIEFGRKIKSIVIDPENRILDIDRVNNYWPKSIYKKPVGFYYFAYEIPVFLDRDFYNLIYGPELSSTGLGIRATLQKPYDDILSLSTAYDFNGNNIKSVLGYEFKHMLSRQLSFGFEIFQNEDIDSEEEDLDGAKAYLRYELWPASYGLAEINDHISFYFIRNRSFEKTLISSGREDIEDFSYRRKHEAIVGINLTFNRAGPYPDPDMGFKTNFTLENAGHFMGGKESFTRFMIEFDKYQLILANQKLAFRIKYGFGSPSDKNLYYLGGDEALRGYGRKANRGSQIILGSIEYRFPLRGNLNLRFFDNIFNVNKLQGVLFFDCGQNWYNDFRNSYLKKDAGIGFRFHIDIGSFLERLILRLDIAQAINEPEEDTYIWLGVSHAF
jgi:hypothetical protein